MDYDTACISIFCKLLNNPVTVDTICIQVDNVTVLSLGISRLACVQCCQGNHIYVA